MTKGWIGVDLDCTLAYYYKWDAWNKIGPVIPPMKARVLKWLAEGYEVKIFTARVALEVDTCHVTGTQFNRAMITSVIQDWLEANGLPRLRVTATKDSHMVELWDDRCVQVVPNTGLSLAEQTTAILIGDQN